MALGHQVMRRMAVTLVSLTLATGASFSLAAEKSYAGISVQLWSVKDEVVSDIKGTLKELADMGFDGVELAGEFGEFADDPEGFRRYLDSLGLTVSGAHAGFDQFAEERFEQSANFYQTLGVDKVIIPADGRAWSAEGIDELVHDLKQLSNQLQPYGIQVGYHNHHSEFNAYQDTTFWDYLAANTPDDIILQLDLGWTVFAQQDPVAYIKRYQNRITTSHFKANVAEYSDVAEQLKEAGPESWGEEMKIVFQHNQVVANESEQLQPLIGQDLVPWEAVIQQYQQSEQPVWFVVEQEIYPNGMEPLAAVEQSLAGLKHFLQQ